MRTGMFPKVTCRLICKLIIRKQTRYREKAGNGQKACFPPESAVFTAEIDKIFLKAVTVRQVEFQSLCVLQQGSVDCHG